MPAAPAYLMHTFRPTTGFVQPRPGRHGVAAHDQPVSYPMAGAGEPAASVGDGQQFSRAPLICDDAQIDDIAARITRLLSPSA